MQWSDLIADPYVSEPEMIMIEKENRKELYEGLRRISEREPSQINRGVGAGQSVTGVAVVVLGNVAGGDGD